MNQFRILTITLLFLIFCIPAAAAQTPAGQASPTEESQPVEPTPAPTNTPAPTMTPTLAGQEEPAPTETTNPPATATATPVPTVTPTLTPIPTATLTPTVTATATSAPTPTSTHTPIPTATPTEIATSLMTATATVTPTATSTPTSTPTPTVTPLWPTDTPTPTPVWTATPNCADGWEPNEQPGSGPPLIIDQSVSDLTLHPAGDVDYFPLWGKGGTYYQITTATSEGLDTRLRVFDPTGSLVAENDDYEVGNPASQVTFMAPGEGWLAVAIDSRSPIQWGCRHYTVTLVDVSPPTATPTATPGPSPTATRLPTATPTVTPIPGEAMYDAYEPNPTFEWAANVGVNQTLNLNFNPYPAGLSGVDNDFFRLYVKGGDLLRFETTGLAEGLDTNLILYRDSGEIVAGNDDCRPGERRSCLEWAPDYTGLAYLLVGPVGTIPEAIAPGARAYRLVIKNVAGQAVEPLPGDNSAAASPTPAFGQPLPWAVTPLPPTATPQPGQIETGEEGGALPAATPTAAVRVRSFSLAPPTATPRPQQTVRVEITVYYDENNNRGPDANEGVAGLSVRLLDSSTNQALGQSFTDAHGHAILAVSAPGEVRLSMPYLGYNQSVKPPGKSLFVRLTPLRLPSLIP